jgi:hypothetical protein
MKKHQHGLGFTNAREIQENKTSEHIEITTIASALEAPLVCGNSSSTEWKRALRRWGMEEQGAKVS